MKRKKKENVVSLTNIKFDGKQHAKGERKNLKRQKQKQKKRVE